MFCPTCGTQNDAGAGFCAKCGARIMAPQAVQPTPQPVVQAVQPVPQPAPQSTYQQPVHAPAQPAYSRPAYDKPHSYRSSYNVRGSGLSWGLLLASLGGVASSFLALFDTPTTEMYPSIFNVIVQAFGSDREAASVGKWYLVYPAVFLVATVISLLLALNAVRRRPGWLGIICTLSGVASAFMLMLFFAWGERQLPMGIGFYVGLISSLALLLITLVQLFAEGD